MNMMTMFMPTQARMTVNDLMNDSGLEGEAEASRSLNAIRLPRHLRLPAICYANRRYVKRYVQYGEEVQANITHREIKTQEHPQEGEWRRWILYIQIHTQSAI